MTQRNPGSPEFSRPLALDRVGAAGAHLSVEASETERAALAARLLVPAVLALRCDYTVTAIGGRAFRARGVLQARVARVSVRTLEEFEAAISEAFTVRFVPAGTESDDLDPESEDEVPYTDGVIDLGEATTEQLALSLDPYPHAPGEAPADLGDPSGSPSGDGSITETGSAHPFDRLATLRSRN